MTKNNLTIETKGFREVVNWKMKNKRRPWPKWVENTLKPEFPTKIEQTEVFTTFINHSTLLLQTAECNIITDPVFSKRIGPFSWLGLKRRKAPGTTIDELPPIHIVLISHNHYDHLDAPSIKALLKKDNPLFIVPLRNGALLKSLGVTRLIELDLWEEHEINGVTITLTPAQHWSRRNFTDTNKSLWGSFMIQTPQLKIYYAGDTGYNTHFKKIKEKWGAIDLSLIPIGAYSPRDFMKQAHMDPDDAVKAHLDLESNFSIGIHFGTFRLSDEGIDEPIVDLKKSLAQRNLSEEEFIAPQNGQTIPFKIRKKSEQIL